MNNSEIKMKAFLKRLFAITLAVTLTLYAAGCSSLLDVFILSLDVDEGTTYSKTLELRTVEGDYERMLAAMQTAESALEQGENYADFETAYDLADEYAYKFVNDYQVKYIDFCMYGKDEDMTAYNDFYSKYLEVAEWEERILHAIMDSPFRNDVFPDMTDEEIIALIGEEKPEEYYTLLEQMKLIESEVQSYDLERLNSVAKDRYVEYVTTANALAECLGYADYMDYSYENVYYRDYTPDDTVNFTAYVNQYVYGEYEKLSSSFTAKTQSLSYSDYNDLMRFFTRSGFKYYMDDFAAFANFMGGAYQMAYTYLWSRNGYYFVSQEENATAGAFTDMLYAIGEPYVYFGGSYVDIRSIVHEFGHYNEFCQNPYEQCYDLDETQSQGGERLFVEYYLQNNKLSDALAECIKDYLRLDAYEYVVLCTMVNEFERAVYKADEITAEVIDAALEQTYASFGGKARVENCFDFDRYWKLVSMQAPCYYISYATSLISSIEIGELAAKDLELGKAAYVNVCEYDFASASYLEVLARAGLSNPFEEETFKKVFGGKTSPSGIET